MGKQPTQGQKKTKDQIAKAASQRSKQTKKKWTKGRAKDKINNAVFLDKAAFDSINSQLPKIGKLVTVSVLTDKFKINGSLARRVLKFFSDKGTLVPVETHNTQYIYTVNPTLVATQKATAAAVAEKQVAKKGKK